VLLVHSVLKKNIVCISNICCFRSAFFWFCNDERSKVKALNPEFGVGDIAKELGRRWSDVDPELKSKYEAMAEKDKARYDRVSLHHIM
jgi:hypothetical protein